MELRTTATRRTRIEARKPENLEPETRIKDDEESDKPRPKQIRIKLAAGKEREIQHMMATSYCHANGTPMSSKEFMEMLFGKLPEFFHNEDELRQLWSPPDTRQKLLQGLSELGFGEAQLSEMQSTAGAEDSDLFDMLAYVA